MEMRIPDFSSSLERVSVGTGSFWQAVPSVGIRTAGMRTSPGEIDGIPRITCVIDATDQENIGQEGSPPSNLDPVPVPIVAGRRFELVTDCRGRPRLPSAVVVLPTEVSVESKG